jgi:hypothetical protein
VNIMTETPEEVRAREVLEWTLWSERRPEDTKALYRWRIPERNICGMMLRPEWGSKLHCVGMGYSDNEWWPDGSHWDGYQRTVAAGLEWRLAVEGEGEAIIWEDLNLDPDPWTGNPPIIRGSTRYIGAPVYDVESFSIHSTFGERYGFTDLNRLQAAWNTRNPRAMIAYGNERDKAIRESRELLAELIAKPSSREFYGIGSVLSAKLRTIELTLASPSNGEEG